MNTTPWTEYAEQQLASTGFAVLDIDIARKLRPSLWSDNRSSGALRDAGGDTGALERLTTEARANGTLYDAVVRATERTRVTDAASCIPRWVDPGEERTVRVVALSAAKLKERLGWLGIQAVTVALALEEAKPVEPSAEERAARAAKRERVRLTAGKLGIC